jgi:hypothetical protein
MMIRPLRNDSDFIGILDRRLFILGVFFLLLALNPGEEPRGDAAARFSVTKQLLTDGRLHLSSPATEWTLIETPKGWTSYFAIGQTLLFVPFEAAGNVLSRLSPSDIAPHVRTIPMNYLYSPLVGVAYVLALLSLLEAFGLSARVAAVVSLLFTFTTVSAHYVAQSFQEEAIASVFICLSMRAALFWRKSLESRHIFAAGLFFATAVLFRLNAAIVLVSLVFFLVPGLRALGWWSPRASQSVAAFLLGALGPAAVHVLFAYLRFGRLFSTGYDRIGDTVPLVLWLPVQFDVVWSLLFGLGKGLFIFSPLLVIALWGIWIDRARLALYGIACLAALACNVILSASFFAPDGCWAWGPRYQVHLLPLFAYPAWVGIRDLLGRRMGAPIVAIVVGLGLCFQGSALLAPDRLEYNQLPINQWTTTQNTEVGCRVILERQFAMRFGNLVTVLRAAGNGRLPTEIKDPAIPRDFGNLWVYRLVFKYPGWVRVAAIFLWLVIVTAAVTCLYRALSARGLFLSYKQIAKN